jgi:mitochondrial inner membrane protease ATP23
MADVSTALASPSKAAATTEAAKLPPPTPVRDDDAESERLCNKWVENGLVHQKNSPIQFLVQHLIDLGCPPPENFIKCIQCDKPQAGGFGMIEDVPHRRGNSNSGDAAGSGECSKSLLRNYADVLAAEKEGNVILGKIKPEIFICQQYMDSEKMTHKTLVHELIHAIDYCRTKMDPVHNCLHLACTEVRAENLSGECSFFKEIPRMTNFAGHGKECVQRRALLSVRANPNCKARAEEYVQAALPRCFRDNYPFDRHPNQK